MNKWINVEILLLSEKLDMKNVMEFLIYYTFDENSNPIRCSV